MAVYKILEANMEKLEKKVTRIQNKCRKYGCDFTFNRIGETFEPVEDEDGNEIITKFIMVEAEGVAIVNDWKFVASVEHTAKGNIIKSCCDVEVPSKYYTTEPICEHCNSKRARKNTCIIQNTVTGEFKQVGNSCLKDFTCGMDVEAVTSYAAMFDTLMEGEKPYGGCGYGEKYYNSKELLVATAKIVKKFGYIRNDGYGRSTKDQLLDYMAISQHWASMRWMTEKFIEECKNEMEMCGFNKESKEADTFVESALEWLKSQEEDSNYMHNLKTVASLDYIAFSNIGILISLIPVYDREVEVITRKAAAQEQQDNEMKFSQHIGNIGDRVEFTVKSAKCLTSWETQWGTTFVYKFVDENNNVYTWKTSKWLDDEEIVGSTIKGSVKEHKEYKGTKQTEITRCKVA